MGGRWVHFGRTIPSLKDLRGTKYVNKECCMLFRNLWKSLHVKHNKWTCLTGQFRLLLVVQGLLDPRWMRSLHTSKHVILIILLDSEWSLLDVQFTLCPSCESHASHIKLLKIEKCCVKKSFTPVKRFYSFSRSHLDGEVQEWILFCETLNYWIFILYESSAK